MRSSSHITVDVIPNDGSNTNTYLQAGTNLEIDIFGLDLEGKGVAEFNGKTIFVRGGLPSERATVKIVKNKNNYAIADIVDVITPSKERVSAQCPHFGICGGCVLQHLSSVSQIHYKELALIDTLKHIGQVVPQQVLAPIIAESWHYRYKARLSVRYVAKKGGVLVGFKERSSSFVADIKECHILPKQVSDLLLPLRQLIGSLSIYDKIPQIEVAMGDDLLVLVVRNMLPLLAHDEIIIKNFVDEYNKQPHGASSKLAIWLQPKNPASSYLFYPLTSDSLYYKLAQFSLTMPFRPTEFTQINPSVNAQMVECAINLLALESTDVVADFFCGIGNFTLAIATKANHVFGVELNTELVSRAISNAAYNDLAHKTAYIAYNLFTVKEDWLADNLSACNKWLIDPPRDGAIELIKSINQNNAPQRIVYVSCNPATLARDAHVLVHVKGYVLAKVLALNMFPHTAHVESIAVFELPDRN